MKRTIGIMALLAAFMLAVLPVYALDWTQVYINMQSQAVIDPVTTYQNTFSIDTTGIEWEPCHIKANYQLGSCDYLYKCYIILPQGCSELSCAKSLACDNSTVSGITTHITNEGTTYTDSIPGTGIVNLQNPTSLTVRYVPTAADIGQTYGVAALIMKSHMQYDWSTKAWTDYTTPIDGTTQYDSIIVEGAGQPSGGDIIAGFVSAINGLIAAIKSWFCSTLHVWC